MIIIIIIIIQRLESHVVTLARSVAHLSSEMRTQHVIVQVIIRISIPHRVDYTDDNNDDSNDYLDGN